MGRTVADGLLLFLAPFLVYGGVLILRRRYPWLADSWTQGALAMLTVAGLGFVVLGLALLGSFAERHHGAYIPAHIEDGRLQPGRIQ